MKYVWITVGLVIAGCIGLGALAGWGVGLALFAGLAVGGLIGFITAVVGADAQSRDILKRSGLLKQERPEGTVYTPARDVVSTIFGSKTE